MKRRTNPPAIAAAVIFGGCLLGTTVQAQDFQQVGPKPVPPPGAAAPPMAAPAPQEPAAPDPARVLIPMLNGLKLIDSVTKVQAKGITGTGLMVDDLPMLNDLAVVGRLEAFLGKPLTQGDLQAIAQTIIDWYREQKYPFVDVAAPAPQDVTNGVVQLVVTESKAGKVTARGNKWFSDGLLIEQVRLEPGDRINIERLENDKNWLNQNPFRTVNIVAARSSEPGTTDFIVDTVKEKFPGRVYVGYDNTGTPVLGHDRWSMGVNWGNAFWMDDQFSYQFTTGDDFWQSRPSVGGVERDPTFFAHATSYVAMLPWHDKLTIFGSYAQAVPGLGPDIGLKGINGQASMRYLRDLPSTQHFDEDIQFGYDFKTSNNNLVFGGFLVSDITTEIDQFLFVYDAKLRDDYGQTSVENIFVYSPGNITVGNKDPLFLQQSGTPFAKANYVYDHIVVTRIVGFPKGQAWVDDLGWFKESSWVTRVVGQKSNRNLLPSEEIGIGGADSVRGYDERSANGSDGMLISEELRSPPFSLGKQLFDSEAGTDLTQLAAFWDYGSISDHQTLIGARQSTQLESVGLGLHVIAGPSANFKLDLNYGFQLRKLPGAADTSQFAHIAVTLAY